MQRMLPFKMTPRKARGTMKDRRSGEAGELTK